MEIDVSINFCHILDFVFGFSSDEHCTTHVRSSRMSVSRKLFNKLLQLSTFIALHLGPSAVHIHLTQGLFNFVAPRGT